MAQSPGQHLNDAVNHAQEYVENQLEIIKLETARHSSKVLAYIAAFIAAGIFFSVFYLMANVALAFYIHTRVESLLLSFLAVALANLLLGLGIMLFRQAIIRPVQNLVIRLITE